MEAPRGLRHPFSKSLKFLERASRKKLEAVEQGVWEIRGVSDSFAKSQD